MHHTEHKFQISILIIYIYFVMHSSFARPIHENLAKSIWMYRTRKEAVGVKFLFFVFSFFIFYR